MDAELRPGLNSVARAFLAALGSFERAEMVGSFRATARITCFVAGTREHAGLCRGMPGHGGETLAVVAACAVCAATHIFLGVKAHRSLVLEVNRSIPSTEWVGSAADEERWSLHPSLWVAAAAAVPVATASVSRRSTSQCHCRVLRDTTRRGIA